MGPSTLSLSLLTLDLATGESHRVYANAPDSSLPIGPRIPHYASWSPDGRSLAFIASTPRGLALFVHSPGEGEGPRPVVTGAPLYPAWRPDGGALLLHVGEDLLLADLLTGTGPHGLTSRTQGFRAPAWSSDGERMAYLVPRSGGGNALVLADREGRDPRPLWRVGSGAAFLWSPAGEEIALLERTDPSLPYSQRLRVVDTTSGEVRTLAGEPALAFFWSPDGEKVAYVALDSGEGRFTWKVAYPRTGQVRPLTEFAPFPELLSLFLFFDQHALSHSLWSPDGTRLVFTGQVGPPPSGGESQVFIPDTDGGFPPQVIAEGSQAFWSWN